MAILRPSAEFELGFESREQPVRPTPTMVSTTLGAELSVARPAQKAPDPRLIENGFKRRHRRENVATCGYPRENLPLGVPEDLPIAMVDRRQTTDDRSSLEGVGGKSVYLIHIHHPGL